MEITFNDLTAEQKEEVYRRMAMRLTSDGKHACNTCTHTYCPNYTPSNSNPDVQTLLEEIITQRLADQAEIEDIRDMAARHGLIVRTAPTLMESVAQMALSTAASYAANQLPEDTAAGVVARQMAASIRTANFDAAMQAIGIDDSVIRDALAGVLEKNASEQEEPECAELDDDWFGPDPWDAD